tara:strand:- start:1238 stop:1468 length:231 start_codon:yes stop_codon:yes gene_type:complete
MEPNSHKPKVIGDVPGLFDAVVRSLPRCDVVEHEKVPDPGVCTAVAGLKLVELGSSSTEQADKFPEKEDHENVKRK